MFIFYSEACMSSENCQGVYWMIPSTKIVQQGFGNVVRSGANKGKYRLHLTNYSERRKIVTPRPKYFNWINAFSKVLGAPVFQCGVLPEEKQAVEIGR